MHYPLFVRKIWAIFLSNLSFMVTDTCINGNPVQPFSYSIHHCTGTPTESPTTSASITPSDTTSGAMLSLLHTWFLMSPVRPGKGIFSLYASVLSHPMCRRLALWFGHDLHAKYIHPASLGLSAGSFSPVFFTAVPLPQWLFYASQLPCQHLHLHLKPRPPPHQVKNPLQMACKQ